MEQGMLILIEIDKLYKIGQKILIIFSFSFLFTHLICNFQILLELNP